jgi:hypothetical protein
MSTDGSREIALKHNKVILIDNNSEAFNEIGRQRLLINEARKIKGPKLLITLDADEMFTPNILNSVEWDTILNSKPGTIIKFQWANFRSDLKTMWFGYYFPWGYMDDGAGYYDYDISEKSIHCGRIPLPNNHDVLVVNQIKVIHFQYVDRDRMKSKQRWYQCYESINFPKIGKVELFRKYHHMEAIPENEIVIIPSDWISEYDKLNIDISSKYIEANNWFEEQVIDLIERHGSLAFKKLNIWDVNWIKVAERLKKTDLDAYKDPRNRIDRFIHTWMLKTQGKLGRKLYRNIDKFIKLFWT